MVGRDGTGRDQNPKPLAGWISVARGVIAPASRVDGKWDEEALARGWFQKPSDFADRGANGPALRCSSVGFLSRTRTLLLTTNAEQILTFLSDLAVLRSVAPRS